MLVALSVLRFNLLISTLIPKKPRIKLQNSIFCSKKVQLGHCPHYRSFRWEDKSLVETGKESKHTHTQPTRISQFTLRTIYKLFGHCRWPCKLSDDVWGQLIFEAAKALASLLRMLLSSGQTSLFHFLWVWRQNEDEHICCHEILFPITILVDPCCTINNNILLCYHNVFTSVLTKTVFTTFI